jgi:hypothetical protein
LFVITAHDYVETNIGEFAKKRMWKMSTRVGETSWGGECKIMGLQKTFLSCFLLFKKTNKISFDLVESWDSPTHHLILGERTPLQKLKNFT